MGKINRVNLKNNQEVIFMCTGWMNFIKFAGVGLLIGTAVGAIFCCKNKENVKEKNMKRKAKKAMDAMEDMLYDVKDMFKKS